VSVTPSEMLGCHVHQRSDQLNDPEEISQALCEPP